ncbi:myophilin-like [Saccostrea cucullata]|uniref:myophilin-like n=1 Tax=Saccostrea cuccullata TaxID=36930 RepID=UPI002ED2B07E
MDNFQSQLKDGVKLCKLVNAIKPGSVSAKKYEKSPTLPFKQMELIGLAIDQMKALGVPDHEMFATVDLHEAQNLHQCVIGISALARKIGAYGPKEAEANKRDFTEEQLKAGQNIIGLQMGTNKGANQSGMNIGNTRHIVDLNHPINFLFKIFATQVKVKFLFSIYTVLSILQRLASLKINAQM